MYTIREIIPSEYYMLNDFLYEAIFQRDETNLAPRNIVEQPELKIFIENFGNSTDNCLVAECNNKIVGAVWTRILCGEVKGFGNIDDQTPEFAISLYKEYRGKGIGTALMKKMLTCLKEKGYKQTSLAVQKDNYAVRMYKAVGFEFVVELDEEFLMVCNLKRDLFSIRQATPNDIASILDLYRNTVLTVNRRDYSQAEVEDWASCGETPKIEEMIKTHYFIVAETFQSQIVGFSSITPQGYLHSMFVHKDFQGKGIATLLLDHIERYAKEQEITKIISEVSLTARPFFEKRGYAVETEQKRQANKLSLTNFWMAK